MKLIELLFLLAAGALWLGTFMFMVFIVVSGIIKPVFYTDSPGNIFIHPRSMIHGKHV